MLIVVQYDSNMYALGLIHTRHFDAQYCDEKICNKKIILRQRFLLTNQGTLFKNHSLICVLFMYLDLFFCQELTLAFRHPWHKNIFLSQYLFIAILCDKMSSVNKASMNHFLSNILWHCLLDFQRAGRVWIPALVNFFQHFPIKMVKQRTKVQFHSKFCKIVSHKLWQHSKLKLNSTKLTLVFSPKPKPTLIK